MSWKLNTIDLPLTTRVVSGVGTTLQRKVTRAVDSDLWQVHGDGKAVPTPLTLEITVQSESGADVAFAEALTYWGLATSATTLTGAGGYSRALDGAQSYSIEQLDCSAVKITITLLPTSGG